MDLNFKIHPQNVVLNSKKEINIFIPNITSFSFLQLFICFFTHTVYNQYGDENE